jgi:hypothetical protein
MKHRFYLCIVLLILCLVTVNSWSQTVYNITKDTKTSSKPFPSQCTDCQINISPGVTLSVNSDLYLSNTHFNGGIVEVKNRTVTFLSQGSFTNTKLDFSSSANLVTSGLMVLNNSEAVFDNSANAAINSSIQLNSSKISLLDNAKLEATAGNFELKQNSSITVGDGNAGSRSFISFTGATLYQYDQSFISLGNFNNYYSNWSSYNVMPSGTSFSILNNQLNCGNGKNPCADPNLYGPSTLTASGFAASAILSVKLEAFTLRASKSSVFLKWKTETEINADRFVIQRSVDGIYWQNAGEVKATGNSAVSVEYSFNDTRPGAPMLYYRLKILDIDKRFEFSPVKSATLGIENLLVLYPNPARSYFTITANSSSDIIHGVLYTDRGAILKRFEGRTPIRVDLTGFARGSYFIKVSTDSVEYQNYTLIVNR